MISMNCDGGNILGGLPKGKFAFLIATGTGLQVNEARGKTLTELCKARIK